MQRRITRGAAVLASLAACSLTASPVMARDPWGWGGHRHRDRVDAGDIIAGILIIGGIAAVASAASKAGRDNRARNDPRYPERDYNRDTYRDYSRSSDRDTRPDWRESGGINAAVNRCLAELDRGRPRVDSVDAVNRDGDGWRVQGRADGNSDFTCLIDGEGRIRQLSIGGRAI